MEGKVECDLRARFGEAHLKSNQPARRSGSTKLTRCPAGRLLTEKLRDDENDHRAEKAATENQIEHGPAGRGDGKDEGEHGSEGLDECRR